MRTVCVLLVAMLVVASLALSGCTKAKETLYILNWGDYIDPQLIKDFETEYGVKVQYDTMANNEEMLIKLESSTSIYDLCFPSDYIIEKLVQKDMLHELNKENIPNIANIDEQFLDLSFDPGNKYSVPYMWGTVGILYNTTMVDEPVDSWSILWDEKYSGQIYMYDSMRDTIGITLKYLGYSMNTRSEQEVAEARDALIQQKPLIKAYLGDTVKDAMIGGEGALAVVYSGDAVWCVDEEEGNPDLAYAVPNEGSNLWFDNAIIPKSSKNPELAEKFINFLNRPEVAKQNSEYIGYSTPNKAALALMDEYWTQNEIYNPPQEVIDRCEIFRDLGDFTSVFSDAWDAIIY
ncbi:MAG: spermidine/putrescine ABC transporter substrate-binding protein [Clostridiales bacterium]|nr:spermidine/putrescine ABC transporter substrate-binding protein [Clostridiales bacterium]